MEPKVCTKCNLPKDPGTDFYKRIRSVDGLNPWCKECCKAYGRSRTPTGRKKVSHRRSHLKLVYSMDEGTYVKLFAKQEGKCAICKSEEPLLIDHSHDSGEVRALLCRKCNTGLGFFYDNEMLLLAAAWYVFNHKTRGEDGSSTID